VGYFRIFQKDSPMKAMTQLGENSSNLVTLSTALTPRMLFHGFCQFMSLKNP
jgi:hypothetical protein